MSLTFLLLKKNNLYAFSLENHFVKKSWISALGMCLDPIGCMQRAAVLITEPYLVFPNQKFLHEIIA